MNEKITIEDLVEIPKVSVDGETFKVWVRKGDEDWFDHHVNECIRKQAKKMAQEQAEEYIIKAIRNGLTKLLN